MGIVVSTASALVDVLASMDNGDTVTLAAGRYLAPESGFRVSRQVRVECAHPRKNRLLAGTIIVQQHFDSPAIVLEAGNTTLEGALVKGPELLAAHGHGIEVARVACVTSRDGRVGGGGGNGIHVPGQTNALVLEDVVCAKSGGHGVYAKGTHAGSIVRGFFHGNRGSGLVLDDCSAGNVEADLEANGQFGVRVEAGWGHVFTGCRFEASPYGASLYGGPMGLAGTVFANCRWIGGKTAVTAFGCRGVLLQRPIYRGVTGPHVAAPWRTVIVRDAVEITT